MGALSGNPWLRGTIKHTLAVLACAIVLLAQTWLRVPSQFLFVLIPIVSVALACLHVAIFANHLLGRAEEEDPLRRAMIFAERVSGIFIRVFVVYSLALFANAALDRSEIAPREADVVEIVGADLDFGIVPHSWIVLRRVDDRQRLVRILRAPTDPPLWPGQPVLVHEGKGFLRLPWVALIAPDDVRQSLATLKHSPEAAEPMKLLIRGYAIRNLPAEGAAATIEYVRLHPADREYPERIALGLGMAGDCARMYEILARFIGRRTDYEFFTHVGYALACLKRRDEAMSYLEKAVALEPENWWAYYHIGYMFFDAQKLEDAEPYFRKVLAKRPIADVARDIGVIQRIVALKRARESAQPTR